MRNEPKSTIINEIIKKNNYTSYLEIGYQLGVNFDRIECQYKTAVDPYPLKTCPELLVMTSGDFFRQYEAVKFDMILIDGSHLCEQVRCDLISSSKQLSKNGCIIMHDVLPQLEEHQTRTVTAMTWCGDVWRSYYGLIKKYPKLNFETHNTDWGVGVIYPNGKVFSGEFEDIVITFNKFKEVSHKVLKVK